MTASLKCPSCGFQAPIGVQAPGGGEVALTDDVLAQRGRALADLVLRCLPEGQRRIPAAVLRVALARPALAVALAQDAAATLLMPAKEG